MSSLFNGWVMDDKEYQIMKLTEENRELKRLLKEYETAFEGLSTKINKLAEALEDVKKEDDGK